MSFIQLVLHVYFSWNFSLHTSISSLYWSSGAFMISLNMKFSESRSKVWPVSVAILSQCLSFIALLAINSSKGQDSVKSSIFFFKSIKACQSFKALGSLRHLKQEMCASQNMPVQASTLTYFSTCPFRQLTKKSTCPIQSFSCPKKFIKITKTRE